MKLPHPAPALVSIVLIAVGSLGAADAPKGVTLDWLGGAAPSAPEGVSWGVPWPEGKLRKGDALSLTSADGKSVAVQTWPLAYWPDGSVEWSGQAITGTADLKGPLRLAIGPATAPATPIRAVEDANGIEIDTGAIRARFPRRGPNLIEALYAGGRLVAQNGRLIAEREDRSQYADKRIIREEDFESRVDGAVLEQAGPVRAVVKVTGMHASASSGRAWLPFTVRFYLNAGSPAIRIVHTFVFDGDEDKDFIKGLGLSFSVPFREELQNRHIRFIGDGDGAWDQPVRMLPGYRPQAGGSIGQLYAAHLSGQRVPNLDGFDPRSQASLLTVPVWGDARLAQLGPNGFSIHKRTTADGSWLHVADGNRSLGLAVLADVSGGIAVGVKHFWQKYPASIEITGAAGRLTIWLWSPDAAAMDLRRYDTEPHGLLINYEDWKPGWGTAKGVANTADLTLWALGAVPSNSDLVAMARDANEPPILVCSPEAYHSLQVFGHWSLPDRSGPAAAWVEDQVQGLVNFYEGQVDERGWYGFWDFGDIMHNYDFGRHTWRYDVGGWAWANTELMPDMLLWYTFLRTGRADIFRMAEAMTRQTSEVEVYHLGPFAPLGSRHNVNHWGDGAKQPRISHAALKRFYYFLTTDERVGDLMSEQLDADLTYDRLKKYNGSHYLPTPGGGAQLQNPSSLPAPGPEALAAAPADTRQRTATLGLEWMCYAINWSTESERGGDPKWRERVLGDMKAMAAGIQNGRLPGRYFDMIFGGPEIMFQLEPMYDVPGFWAGWANTCEAIGRETGGGDMTAPRMLAYAAHAKKSPELGLLAWTKLIGDALPPPSSPAKAAGANLLKPVTDPAFLGAPVGWQLHGVASVQWALNAIETKELAGEWLPQWEAAHAKPKQ